MNEVTLENAPQKVRDLFNKGFTALERGNLDYAIDLLGACVEMEPGFMQARKYLRSAEVKKFRKTKTNALTHVISTVGDLPNYLKMMALLRSGKAEAALALGEKLLRDDPLNLRFIKLFAKAAVSAGLADAAVQTLEIARDSYPNDITIINWLGNLYQKVGRTRSARECFEKLCEICPNDPDVLKSLKDAMALDSMAKDGWSDTAEKGGSYRDLIRDSKEATLLEQDSKAVKTDKDTDALIVETRQKITDEPGNINYYRALARLYGEKKAFADAQATLKKAMDLSPGDPELDNAMSSIRAQEYDHRIAALKTGGDQAGADAMATEKEQFLFDDLQERVRRYPNDLAVRHEWGVVLLNNDYVNEAIQQFQMSQRNPKYRIRSLYYLAMCFKKKQQYDMAAEQMERAASELVAMDDTRKEICYELGGIYEAMGNPAKAAEFYKQIYQVDIGYRDIVQKIEKAYSKKS